VIEYRITFARSARKELFALDKSLIERVLEKIDNLSHQPRPKGCRKLQGNSPLFRIRVGEYRVIYAVFDDEKLVDIVAVRHRSDVYR